MKKEIERDVLATKVMGMMFFMIFSMITWAGCLPPNPIIKCDGTDAQGRVSIPVVNWSAYPDEMFQPAPELPPCGTNTSSSRTWVDIYNADTNARIYGFCALDSNADLKTIWFKPSTPNGNVYIILQDRAANKNYKSNTIAYGECCNTPPDPRIKYDHTDADGRIYIPVDNWSAYPNEMFRKAPELPPCGANTNSSRTWVDIHTAGTNTKLYGFCAFGSNADLKTIWFKAGTPTGKAYIIMQDRACGKSYKSNTIAW